MVTLSKVAAQSSARSSLQSSHYRYSISYATKGGDYQSIYLTSWYTAISTSSWEATVTGFDVLNYGMTHNFPCISYNYSTYSSYGYSSTYPNSNDMQYIESKSFNKQSVYTYTDSGYFKAHGHSTSTRVCSITRSSSTYTSTSRRYTHSRSTKYTDRVTLTSYITWPGMVNINTTITFGTVRYTTSAITNWSSFLLSTTYSISNTTRTVISSTVTKGYYYVIESDVSIATNNTTINMFLNSVYDARYHLPCLGIYDYNTYQQTTRTSQYYYWP